MKHILVMAGKVLLGLIFAAAELYFILMIPEQYLAQNFFKGLLALLGFFYTPCIAYLALAPRNK